LLTCLELGEVVGHRTAGNLTATSPTCLGVGYIGGNDPKRQGQRHSPNASDSGLRNEACERFRWILGFRFLYFFLGFFHSLFISSSSCIHLALQKLVLHLGLLEKSSGGLDANLFSLTMAATSAICHCGCSYILYIFNVPVVQ